MVVQMTSTKEIELAEELTKKLQLESKKCITVSDYVNLVFSFKHDNYSIMPIQIKNEIEKLISVLNSQKPKTLMEIGTANGGTLFLLCQAAATNDATILSLDLLGGKFGGELFPSWKEPFYQNFSKKNQQLSLIRADSHDSNTFKKVKQLLDTKKLDFLLIDGDHKYGGVKQDFQMYSKLVSPSGIIAFHDINPGPKEEVGGVPTFWKEIAGKYPSFEIIEDDGRPGSYGIGFIIFEPLDKSLIRYTKIAKNLFEIQISQLSQLQKELHKVNLVVQEKDKEIHDYDQSIIGKNKQLRPLQDELHKVNLVVQEKDKEIHERGIDIKNRDKKTQEYDQSIIEKKKQISLLEDQIKRFQKTIHDKNSIIEKNDHELLVLETNMKKLERRNQQLLTNETKIQKLEQQIHEKNTKISKDDELLDKTQSELEKHALEINQKIQDIKEMQVIISELERIKNENEAKLKESEQFAEDIRNSKTWKSLQRYIKAKKFITGKP